MTNRARGGAVCLISLSASIYRHYGGLFIEDCMPVFPIETFAVLRCMRERCDFDECVQFCN